MGKRTVEMDVVDDLVRNPATARTSASSATIQTASALVLEDVVVFERERFGDLARRR